MSLADPNWPRWIFSSVSKHFSDAASNAVDKDGVTVRPIPIYTEGNDRTIQSQTLEYFECRMDGPYFEELSKGWWQVTISVNLLAVAKRNPVDFHRLHYLCGVLLAAFTTNIEIYKYGAGVQDTNQILTCLTLTKNKGENIMVHMLGELNPDLKEDQAMVEAYYQGIIET